MQSMFIFVITQQRYATTGICWKTLNTIISSSFYSPFYLNYLGLFNIK